ncbi:MAG TPA: hypothetical protein PKZ74_08750 [Bacteroidales bacterium]|nr:hypothetical protein [Bacteroidales bacterium]
MKTKRWKKGMVVMIILLAGWHTPARPGIIVTGILDGTLTGGSPKAVEIFVTGTENLNNYEVWRSLNGAPFGSGSGSVASLNGVFTNTFVYLVKTDHVNAFHDVFGNEGIFANVVPMGIINGNGNDGFQVRKKVGSVVIDQVWLEDASYSYEDSYWYRKNGTGPDGGWIPSAWETPGNGALDGLDQEGLRAAVPFGTYASVWLGINSAWNDSVNWSLGYVPTSQTNVVIPDSLTEYPLIFAPPLEPATCLNLFIAENARLTVESSACFTISGNMEIESPDTTGALQGLILSSDPNPEMSGSLIVKGTAVGKVTVRRYIPKNNNWHLIASPADTQYFQPEFVPVPVDQSFDLYYWNETAEFNSGWINCRDENGGWYPGFETGFHEGKGYLAAYSPATGGNEVRRFYGRIRTGDYSFPLSCSGNAWNLLGNPYTCALDWASAGISKESIAGSAVYLWDPYLNSGQGGYRAHNGTTGVPSGTSPSIPAMQGFFVNALVAGTIVIDTDNDAPLIHGDHDYYKETPALTANQVRLRISNASGSDEALVYFDPQATNQYDPLLDATKLFGLPDCCPEIFTLTGDNHSLCINLLNEVPVSIPIGISFPSEDYLVVSAFGHEFFDPGTDIFLEDLMTGTWTDLGENPDYGFFHDPDAPGIRFMLHFSGSLSQDEPNNMELPDLQITGNLILIRNPKALKGMVETIAPDGRQLYREPLKGGEYSLQAEPVTPIYIVRIITNAGTQVRKAIYQP